MSGDTNQSRPGWAEPYLWLVVGLPLAAVVACLVTGLYIFTGSDAARSEEHMPQAKVLAQELGSAEDSAVPAVVGRNHSSSGGVRHAKP